MKGRYFIARGLRGAEFQISMNSHKDYKELH